MRRVCEEKFMPIPLGEGHTALVSPEDYEELSSFDWIPFYAGRDTVIREDPASDFLGTYYPLEGSQPKSKKKIYAVEYFAGPKPRRPMFMHDMLISRSKGEQVVFLDRNTLNNCRSNLVTTSEYREMLAERSEAYKERRKAKYRGVQEVPYYKPSKWQSLMTWAGERYYLGQFDDPESAARAYDALAVTLGRDPSVLNFPEEWPEHNPQFARLKLPNKIVGGEGMRTRLLSRVNNALVDQLEDNQGSPRHTPTDRPKRKRFVLRGSSNATLPPENVPDVEVVNDRLLDLMADFGL